MAVDILKIQRAIRKSVESYGVEDKHDKEALVILISVDLYLALGEKEIAKPKKPIIHLEKSNVQV